MKPPPPQCKFSPPHAVAPALCEHTGALLFRCVPSRTGPITRRPHPCRSRQGPPSRVALYARAPYAYGAMGGGVEGRYCTLALRLCRYCR